jgi:hypothetical protein
MSIGSVLVFPFYLLFAMHLHRFSSALRTTRTGKSKKSAPLTRKRYPLCHVMMTHSHVDARACDDDERACDDHARTRDDDTRSRDDDNTLVPSSFVAARPEHAIVT